MKGATREGAGMAGSGKMRIEAETEKGVDGGEGRWASTMNMARAQKRKGAGTVTESQRRMLEVLEE